MEVLNASSALLSNYEVFDMLQSMKSNKKQKMIQNQLATITYQTIRYLEETPCKKQTPEKIRKYLEAMKSFNLTKSEKLTLLNICPKTALEIQLIIEDSEERLSTEEVESLLEIIQNCFEEPLDEQEEEEEGC
ncbi:hypothetical protein M0804_008399 [Polistes exclamans]|nr:hypothetical protein M0804_008399 [Polistes exclamans]